MSYSPVNITENPLQPENSRKDRPHDFANTVLDFGIKRKEAKKIFDEVIIVN